MASAKKEETDLFDLAKDLVKNWHIMLPCLILSGILGIIIAMWIRPVYQVDALLQIESKSNKGMASAMMGGLGSLFASSSPAETEIELIKSRQIIGDAVDKMHLQYIATPTRKLQRLFHKEGYAPVYKSKFDLSVAIRRHADETGNIFTTGSANARIWYIFRKQLKTANRHGLDL